MDAYLKLVQGLAQDFDCFALTQIPRYENVQADALAALASSFDPGLKRVIPVEFIEHPSIGPPIVVNLIEGQDDEEEEITIQPPSEQSDYGCDISWLQMIRDYIIDGQLATTRREMGSSQSPNTGRTLRDSRRRNLQMKILRTTHDVPGREKNEESNGRSTFRFLQQPFRRKIASRENQTPWILLANNNRRLREIRTKMRKIPKACTNHPTTGRSSFLHHIALPLYALGHGYCRTSA